MRARRTTTLAVAGAVTAALIAAGCGDDAPTADPAPTAPSPTATAPAATVDEVVDVGGRGLYLRCTGSGSPAVVMEAGDESTTDEYAFAEGAVAAVTRTCVYDRANLGLSDPAPGPRQLPDLVGDLERLLAAAAVPPPYVLVGSSGGGYIVAGFAVANPRRTAGVVLVDTAAPFRNPPPQIVAETDPDNPANVERRDYLQVERDAWAARRPVGDIPVRVLSADFPPGEEAAAPTASERRAMRRNVPDQRGWLVLSPRAEQVVTNTGHDVGAEDPQLVIDELVEVVEEARASG